MYFRFIRHHSGRIAIWLFLHKNNHKAHSFLWFLKMHVFVFKWFFEVARIAISVDFCYSITRVETALQLCLRKPKLCHKVLKEKRESFSCLPHEFHVSSCSKGSLVHHFCWQSASSFSRLFLSLFGTKWRCKYGCTMPRRVTKVTLGQR